MSLKLKSVIAVALPKATPQPIVDRLNSALTQIGKSTDTRLRYAKLGFEPITSTPEAARTFLTAETERWRTVVAAAGVRVE